MPGPVGALTRMVTDSILLGALYLAAVAVLHGGLAPLVQFRGLLLEMLPWRKYSRNTLACAAPAAEAKLRPYKPANRRNRGEQLRDGREAFARQSRRTRRYFQT